MHLGSLQLVLVAGTFVLAGCVKGVTGMGLPTVAIALLGLVMAPAQAAALLVVPSLATNLWQFLAGPHRLVLLRRMWPMLLAISMATGVAAGLISGAGARHATLFLGLTLIAYALLGLSQVRMTVGKRSESWLSPLVGAATGVVTGATGVFVIPAVPYLQALGFDRDDLVQVLGLSFTVSTMALALGLASYGAFRATDLGVSLLCMAPAFAGMSAGQALRSRIDSGTFRVLFFAALMLLGGDLAIRAA